MPVLNQPWRNEDEGMTAIHVRHMRPHNIQRSRRIHAMRRKDDRHDATARTVVHYMQSAPTFRRDKDDLATLKDFPHQPTRDIIQIKT
jgi:hypothetical protein